MKRLLITLSVLGGVALLPLAAQAQRGMAGHAASGHVATARVGAGVGAHSVAGTARTNIVRPIRINRATVFPGQKSFSPFIARFDRFRFRNRFFFNNCFGRFGFSRFGGGCGGFGSGGLGYGGLYDPYLYGAYDQPQQQQQQPVVVEGNGNDDNRELAYEIAALGDEIKAMHEEERAHAQAQASPTKSSIQEEGNAVLVFRDGHQLPVRNYAVTDHTIWVFNNSNAHKYSVSDLDVQATQQANARNGVDFKLPGGE